jgi:antitoxin component YwqK of YwqJK toxin-antitoxin module
LTGACKPVILGRRSSTGSESLPLKLAAIITCVDYDDYLEHTLPRNRQHFDEVLVVTSPRDVAVHALCERHGATAVITERFFEGGAIFNKGKGINDALTLLAPDIWAVHLDADIVLPPGARQSLSCMALEPDTLHGCVRSMCPSYTDWIRYTATGIVGCEWEDMPPVYHDVKTGLYMESFVPVDGMRLIPLGYFQIFRTGAVRYPENSPGADSSDMDFALAFERTRLLDGFRVIHLPSGGTRDANWKGRATGPFSTVVQPRFEFRRVWPHTMVALPDAHGPVRVHYPGGGLAVEGHMANGLGTGRWIDYLDGGGVERTYHLRRGRLHGELTRHDADGTRHVVQEYREGLLDGQVTTYADGRIEGTGAYSSGRLDGMVKEWYPDGRLAAEVSYRKGRKHGPTRIWHEHGRLAVELEYEDGEEHGPYRMYHPNGQPLESGTWWHGRRHGVVLRWHENGQKSGQGRYRNGMQQGAWQSWPRLTGAAAALVPPDASTTLRVVTQGRGEPALAPGALEGRVVARFGPGHVGHGGLVFDLERILAMEDCFAGSLDEVCRAVPGATWEREQGLLHLAALIDLAAARTTDEDGRVCQVLPRTGPGEAVVHIGDELASLVHPGSASRAGWLLEAVPRLLAVLPWLRAHEGARLLVDLGDEAGDGECRGERNGQPRGEGCLPALKRGADGIDEHDAIELEHPR